MNTNLTPRNIYYGYDLKNSIIMDIEDKVGQLENIYDKINVNCYMNEDNTSIINPTSVDGTLISKSIFYQYPNATDRLIKSLPPKGPINEYCMCIYCEREGPQFHTEDCPGPYDEQILTVEGIIFYEDKIKNTFTQETLNTLDQVYYRDIFPKRGVQKLISENYTSSNFKNVVQLIYKTVNGSIPIKIGPNYNIYTKKIPYDLIKPTDYKKNLLSLLPKTYKSIKYEEKISDVNCIVDLIKEDYTIDLETLNDYFLQNKKIKVNNNTHKFNDYSFSSYYNFIKAKFILENNEKVTIMIRSGGTVTIFLSNIKKFNIQTLKNIANGILGILTEDMIETKEEQTSAYFDLKILNTAPPYTIANKKFKYNSNIKKSGSFPPQPQTCRNRLPKKNVLTKADIKRPVPFSFTYGRAPARYLRVMDEGRLTTGTRLLGDRDKLYEPCCEAIQGKTCDTIKGIGKISFYPDTFIITPEKIQKLKVSASNIKITEEKFMKMIKSYIANSTSTKEKIFRRLFYGFPNKEFPQDSHRRYHIRKGYETIPVLEKDEYYKGQTTKFTSKKQEDIHSAVYIPGTQLKNYRGNNKLIRDSRKYKGLLQYTDEDSKDILFEIIRKYFDKFSTYTEDENLKEIIPLHESNIDEFKKLMGAKKIMYTIVPKKSILKFEKNELMFYLENTVYTLDYKNTEKRNLINRLRNVNREHIKPLNLVNFDDIKDSLRSDRKVVFIENSTWSNSRIFEWYPGIENDYIAKSIIQFKVISKAKNNLLEIGLPTTGKKIKNDILMTVDGKKYLFVQSKNYNIKVGSVYRFSFNFFKQTDGGTMLVENQPFVMIDTNPIKKIDPDSKTLKTLKYALEPVFEEELF